MNVKRLFYLKKINIAKVFMLGCIFLFTFLVIGSKVNALSDVEVLSSTYSGNGNNIDAQEVNGVKFIQGSGVSNHDGITFRIYNMYNSLDDFTAFAVWEAAFSESAGEYKDYDRWYLRSVICSDASVCEEFNAVTSNSNVVRDLETNNIISYQVGQQRYYIERSSENIVTNPDDNRFVQTVVDFSKFFSDKEIIYTYRIRNVNYINTGDGFGYKELQINYWRAGDGSSTTPYQTVTVEFGLARAISDVNSHTNKDDTTRTETVVPFACDLYKDDICVDYADTNGIPSHSTTVPKSTNVYIPDNVLYSHSSTSRVDVINHFVNGDQVDLDYVKNNNSLYAFNYFCEGANIDLATISFDSNGRHIPSCSAGILRQYVYVESQLIGKDINDSVEFKNQETAFMESPYKVSITVDSRGYYVIIITDLFGNTNEVTIVKVMDIINQALIAYFGKSNKTTATVEEANGWRADEYLTNQDVMVTITMSATTVIEQGLPIIAAETTLLDSSYIKNIYYWRVDGSKYLSDICEEGTSENCAMLPSSGNYTVLYSNESGNNATTNEAFVGFDANRISMNIHSNGRYRFYIETFANNNTNTNDGEKKNPRVEVYKIDKEAPEILFGGASNSYCKDGNCSYVENTYQYYQGTGNENGTLINNLVKDSDTDYVITYTKDGIYYPTANGDNSLIASAGSKNDIFFDYLYALFNTKTYINENLRFYDVSSNDDVKTLYSHFYLSSISDINYVLDNNALLFLDESAYREYIISNDIKYTAYSLASNSNVPFRADQEEYQQSKIKIEYFDGESPNMGVCEKLGSVFNLDLDKDGNIDQQDCVNYYLDHGIDFRIKITAFDVVQDNVGNYILGNSSDKEIYVDVVDNTTPGFSKEIKKYNVGSECRIELGSPIGINSQNLSNLLECYGMSTSSDGSIVFNFEDNVFASLYTRNQTVNTMEHISLYILSLETGKWISLDSSEGYTPNRSGNYAILVILHDDASDTTTTFDLSNNVYHGVRVANNSSIEVEGNAIATLISYYVDKKLVLVTPKDSVKNYGEEDPVIEYCVHINKNNGGIATYLAAPFKDMSVFSPIGECTINGKLGNEEKEELFKGNYGKADFTGALTRQESGTYNAKYYGNVSNNYVGLYKIVLGTLNITGSDDGYDLEKDYIVKINPNVRNDEYQLATIDGASSRRDNGYRKCNLADSQIIMVDGVETEVSGCYGFKEDDDFFVESTATLTIRQVILTVRANGASKIYGTVDPNSDKYNSNYTGSPLASDKSYLNGFTIEGLKYSDTNNVVLGVLRREVGENVGVYSICNYRGLLYEGSDLIDTKLESINNMLVVGSNTDGNYSSCSNFDNYASVVVNTGVYKNGILDIDADYIRSRALYIDTNVRDGLYKTLNVTTDLRNNNYANYVINYIEGVFTINPSTMIVQPTPGQRREYNYNGVDEVNPWEVVVYGEKEFKVSTTDEFNGYTADSPVFSASPNDPQSVDLGSPDSGVENYNNASEIRDEWKLIHNSDIYLGFKTNESYSLFDGRISLVGQTASDGVFKGMRAGWYNFNELVNTSLTIKPNSRKQCEYSNYISSASIESSGDCRNYNLVIDLNYRNEDGYKNNDLDEEGNPISVVYKSKDKYCKTTTLGAVSDPDLQCSELQSSQILFEVYRREIILEFNSLLEKIPFTSEDLVYGFRYDHYYENLFEISNNSNNKNNLENDLFYCYASYNDGIVGLNGDCTTNKWYGLTENDSWANIGLEFHLHSDISSSTSGYYSSINDKAIPAGRYYVYASISDDAKNNYRFNYLGGTFTIKSKAVEVSITDHSKEYGNVYYDDVICLKDGSILNISEQLISDCSDTSNSITNTYGFVINGLDIKDTINENFSGRPIRDSNLANTSFAYTDVNGLQENVGIYTIRVGSVHSKNNNNFKTCDDHFIGNELDGCVTTSEVSINNYVIGNDSPVELTYYLLKNGTLVNDRDYSSLAEVSIVNADDMIINDGSLTINPATIDIKVIKGQTKMYGCAYNKVNTTSLYNYSYIAGYECEQGGGATNYDLGYGYIVSGDKDYYIYNFGYYQDNYDFDVTYTSDRINVVNKSSVDNSLLKENSVNVGLRSSALNGGVLYRVSNRSTTFNYSDLIIAANNNQALTHYQGQSVGKYIITLGNLNATLSSDLEGYNATNNRVCDASNVPGRGNEICRNYIISYYDNTSVSQTHTYSSANDADTTFEITPRVAFIYTSYNSKVYGNRDPDVSCNIDGQTVLMGLNCYHVKENSLAKAPWVVFGNEDSGIAFAGDGRRDDRQVDIVEGKLSRVGMDNGVKQIDDIVGTYNYLFDDIDTTDYGKRSYILNTYLRELNEFDQIVISNGNITNEFILDTDNYNQFQAVNENGGNTQEVEGKTKNILFEINLRKITVSLISFAKVYGIEDNSTFFDLGVCATGDQQLSYDAKGNPICSYLEGKTSTEHGLSPTHISRYMNEDGTLKQAEFKDAFKVWFARALGENVTCSNKNVTNTIFGYFDGGLTSYTYDLGCNNNGYEALGFINQNRGELGYNYEVTYVVGEMSILARTILITPDSNQGFQYGSYTYPTLIPAITFSNSLVSADYGNSNLKVVSYDIDGEDAKVVVVNRDKSISQTSLTTSNLGLVHGESNSRICLRNIDNNAPNFCINDRQDVYATSDDEKTISTYKYNNDGDVSDANPTYVFGDVYENEESMNRHALNRSLSDNLDLRYSREVGVYTITLGDLVDENNNDLTGNYLIRFISGVSYTITPANVKITPDSDQNKVYGQSDKELTFKVETTYTVNSSQYLVFDESIAKIVDSSGNNIAINRNGLTKISNGSTVTLNGFAYYENSDNENYNYGLIKNSNKSSLGAALAQDGVSGKSFDKYCYDNYNDNSSVSIGSIDGCNEQNVSFENTNLVLVGYLYVDGYKQKAGEHLIVNGFVVSDNAFKNKNYVLEVVDDVIFEIKKLDINLLLEELDKDYGQASDAYKCDVASDCLDSYATLKALDNRNMLEFNFNISFKDNESVIGLTGDKVLMVSSINGNYYTQSEGEEDKNNFLGVNVIRKKNNDTVCSVDNDRFGCEDAGNYELVFRKMEVNGLLKDGSIRYDDNYNLMFNNTSVGLEEISDPSEYVVIDTSTHEVINNLDSIKIIDNISGILNIAKRKVDIFVNTILNSTSANYYEIEQNIEVPNLPTIDNNYNLIDYKYDPSKVYHGIGEEARSSSANSDLDSTYTRIVWGRRPNQVRTSDALVGSLAYCNEAANGNLYPDEYPSSNVLCSDTNKLVYNENKAVVNTNTRDKFIIMTRDTTSDRGLKIMNSSTSSGVNNNNYEDKNYDVEFYPGAIHVIGDSGDPTLVVGEKDYYIEANASVNDGGDIYGSTNSIGTILEYLFNGDTKEYILASIDENGNMYITIDSTKIDITQASLLSKYGNSSDTYPGIITGVEQVGVYPFISDYAHNITTRGESYLNETNIKSLEELITTLIKWFKVTSYDSGQLINGQYLERKFDKYYYVSINKNGYDIASDIDNLFAVNKVGTYTVTFYVMDNAGRISKDGNSGKLHIIDTTAPNVGELTLYNSKVKCDSECNDKEKWYINQSSVRLASFNRYTFVAKEFGNYQVEIDGVTTDGEFILDRAGEYIYFAEIGNITSPYKSIASLASRITTNNYVDYIDTSDAKYSAQGVTHYTWNSNETGIYLTITGGSDNSYTQEGNSGNSQWNHYYSIDGGVFFIEYEMKNEMEGYSATISDGVRLISITAIDSGVNKIQTDSILNSISYDRCYQGCKDVEILNKVRIDGNVYEFGENDVNPRTFEFDENTVCTINSLATLITCTTITADGSEAISRTKLEGNKFTYRGGNYIISGNNILTASGSYAFTLVQETVTLRVNSIDITYRLDRSAMRLYRDYIATFGLIDERGTVLHVGDVDYLIVGNEIKLGGVTVTELDNYSFTLNGITYNYIDDVSTPDGYYYGSVSYDIYQDSFKVDGVNHNISEFDSNGKLSINQDTLSLTRSNKYTTTYELYDKYLLGLDKSYTDINNSGMEAEIIAFRNYITSHVAWNRAISDEGEVNEEISNYLNEDIDTLYFKDRARAYLDTVAPVIGINITTIGANEEIVNVRYGEDWYVYEFGYYNSIELIDSKYSIRGTIYTVNRDEMVVVDSNNNRYEIKETSLEDDSKKYVYVVNYNNYYINASFTNVIWLNSYVERFVGSKDLPSNSGVSQVEVRYYSIDASMLISDISTDTRPELQLIEQNTTMNSSSGIGRNKYSTSGISNALFDFVNLGHYESGIYYEDIDYIVWYIDNSGAVVKVDLNDEFKECYLSEGTINQDCAQEAIAKVIAPNNDINRDITYTINYVVRDKAGNASSYASRGVLYATIMPSTNVIINNIEASATNSEIVVANIDTNTYSLKANQGVSLELLEEAFKINYSTTYKNYNNAAVMTIYKEDELIANNVSGVAFTNYIDSSEIADYKIVYSMNSTYTTYLGEEIPVSGEVVTLYLSIGSPKVDEDSEINFDKVIKNNDSIFIMIAIMLGCISLIGVGIIFVKKRR